MTQTMKTRMMRTRMTRARMTRAQTMIRMMMIQTMKMMMSTVTVLDTGMSTGTVTKSMITPVPWATGLEDQSLIAF